MIGKSVPVRIFEPLGEPGRLSPDTAARSAAYAAALADYRARRFESALEGFLGLEGDPAAAVFAARCRMLLNDPPSGDWDGVFVLKEK